MPVPGAVTKSIFPSTITWNPGAFTAPPRTSVVDELDSALLDDATDELDFAAEELEFATDELDFAAEELDCDTELLDTGASLLEETMLELDGVSELLDDSGKALLDKGGTNTHPSTTIFESSAKHTFVSGSAMLNSPGNTTELSHASTGESFVTFWLPGNGSSFCLVPPPWLM